jgi:hypothetical protein
VLSYCPAACLRGSRRLVTAQKAAGITVPVDEIAGSAEARGKIIPGSQVLNIPNRDHMRAVGDKVYKVGAGIPVTSEVTRAAVRHHRKNV